MPTKMTLQNMVSEANPRARVVTSHRDSLITELHGAELRINELQTFRSISADTVAHLKQRIVDADSHTVGYQARIARLERENEEQARRLGEFLPGAKFSEPQVHDIKARLINEYDGKLNSKQEEVDKNIVNIRNQEIATKAISADATGQQADFMVYVEGAV